MVVVFVVGGGGKQQNLSTANQSVRSMGRTQNMPCHKRQDSEKSFISTCNRSSCAYANSQLYDLRKKRFQASCNLGITLNPNALETKHVSSFK